MDRPIPFSIDMVKRILDSGKWQTRRTRGLDRFNQQPGRWRLEGKVMAFDGGFEYADLPKCPYGDPGDRLWVRETWGLISPENMTSAQWYETDRPFRVHPDSNEQDGVARSIYKADGEWAGTIKWKPSRFMPRWASRIMLEITRVRVERIQDISYEDAIAEGIVQSDEGFFVRPLEDKTTVNCCSPIPVFESLWNEKNMKRGYGWDVNPWVWAIDFRMVQS